MTRQERVEYPLGPRLGPMRARLGEGAAEMAVLRLPGTLALSERTYSRTCYGGVVKGLVKKYFFSRTGE